MRTYFIFPGNTEKTQLYLPNFVFNEKKLTVIPVYFSGQLIKKTSDEIGSKIPTQIMRSPETSVFTDFNLTNADFPLLVTQFGSPPKVIKLNTGNQPTKLLWDKYRKNFKSAIKLLQNTDAEIIFIE